MTVAHIPSAAAQTSMRQTASPTLPRRSDATMNGKAGRTLSTGTTAGIPTRNAATYESAVPPTIAAGTHAGFMSKDYTPANEALLRRGRAVAGPRRNGLPVEHAGPSRRGGRTRPRHRHHARVRVLLPRDGRAGRPTLET